MSTSASNPLLKPWTTLHGTPPFHEIRPDHFREALPVALDAHKAEIAELVSAAEPPTFENTIARFDRSGALLKKVRDVFHNLCSSSSSTELQAVELEFAGPLAAHDSHIYMSGLYARIAPLYESRASLGLTAEQVRLVEVLHLDFVRSGAKFDEAAKARYSKLMERLAVLNTQFTQNIVADESDVVIPLSEADLEGVPDYLKAACRAAAEERGGKDGPYVVTLSRSLVVPFLTCSPRRDLREKAWRAWTSRGELELGTRDNRAVAMEILALRSEQARMHGYADYAAFSTADTMASNPDKVMELLELVWAPAKAAADRERVALLEYVRATEGNGKGEGSSALIETIEPWDWRYYAEKVRASRYDVNEEEIKPYFSLDRMCEAIFDCAHKLFRLKFLRRADIATYHPDVAAYEVFRETDGQGDQLVGVFLHDNFSRKFKQSGAWMSEYRSQSRNVDDIGSASLPVIVNNNNFAKGAEGEPTLLSFDDAKTLFHEFGHGLHGLLSNVTYQRLAGTSVLRDFVELPSQLYEHWLSQPQVLKAHARHFETGEPIPDELVRRMMAAKKFNQGFDTVEYTASALLDQHLHKVAFSPEEAAPAVRAALEGATAPLAATEGGPALAGSRLTELEAGAMQRVGLPQGIILRHRAAHFQHLFSSSGYAAGYYSYLWAEVLDADVFDAFLETGDIFHAGTAERLLRCVYSAGNSVEPGQAFRDFRGREPAVQAMLRKKGLDEGLEVTD